MVYIDERALRIYTDGSQKWKPRRGGWAFRIVWIGNQGNDKWVEDKSIQSFFGATNVQMELEAVIGGLNEVSKHNPPVELARFSKVFVMTDLLHIVNDYKKSYYWRQSDWKNQHGRPYENHELWKKIHRLVEKISRDHKKGVEFVKVKAHSKDPHNIAVDGLAKEAADSPIRKQYGPTRVRRKRTASTTKTKSIPMKGQLIILRVTEEQIVAGKKSKYRCEVHSAASKYAGGIQFIYSDLTLRAGHVYRVRLNDDDNFPTITRLYREITKKS